MINLFSVFLAAEERAAKVIQSAKEPMYLQPFKDTMTAFFEKGMLDHCCQETVLHYKSTIYN